MLIKTKQIESLLLNESVTGYSLEQVLPISRSSISEYRRGDTEIDKINLAKAKIIQKYIDDGNYKIVTVDEENILDEIKNDYDLLDNEIIIVEEWLEAIEKYVIVDYMNKEDFEISQISKTPLRFTLKSKENVLKSLEFNIL